MPDFVKPRTSPIFYDAGCCKVGPEKASSKASSLITISKLASSHSAADQTDPASDPVTPGDGLEV